MEAINEARTAKRSNKRELLRFKNGGLGATGQFRAVDAALDLIGRLAKHIPNASALEKPTQLNLLLRELNADELALVAVASLTHSYFTDRSDPGLTLDLGRAVEGVALEQKVLRRRSNKKLLKHIAGLSDQDSRNAAVERAAWCHKEKEWSEGMAIEAGNLLLDWFLEALSDVFVKGNNGPRGEITIDVHESKKELVRALRELSMWKHPVLDPSPVPPMPWTGWRKGGYWDERTRPSVAFLTAAAAHHKETEEAFRAAFRSGVMQQHVDGVNALQAVPYRINEPVFAAVKHYGRVLLEKEFRKKAGELENIFPDKARYLKKKFGEKARELEKSLTKPTTRKRSLAEELDVRLRWNARNLKKELRWNDRDFKKRLRNNARNLKTAKKQLREDLRTARRLKGAPFYIPLNCDFRGRMNGIPYFNYQRGDQIRSMFLFEHGLPVGDNLQRVKDHLEDHVAACWGNGVDKLGILELRKWCADHEDLIEKTARLKTEDWHDAEDPFAFYAACLELMSARTDPNFITRLPLPFDGSSSGLQHILSMTLSEEAKLVNLGAVATADSPADFPGLVVVPALEARAKQDKPLYVELQRQGIEINRPLAKGPAVNYSYGQTRWGVGVHLAATLEERGQWLDKKLLNCLSKLMLDEIERILPRAKTLREFLQKCAKVLAEHNEPLQWPTPTGFPWANRYDEPETEILRSVLRGVYVRRKYAEGYKREIVSKDAVKAVGANVTHGLDAALLMRTVNASKAAGITNIMAIHDSFGCLAPQADLFNKIIRDEHVRMYLEHDPPTEIRECALRSLAKRARVVVEKKRPSQMAEALSQHPLAPRVKGKRVAKARGISARYAAARTRARLI